MKHYVNLLLYDREAQILTAAAIVIIILILCL